MTDIEFDELAPDDPLPADEAPPQEDDEDEPEPKTDPIEEP